MSLFSMIRFILFNFSLILFADGTAPISVEDLCKYDSYCRYSFDDSGKAYPVKQEVRFILANLHEEIVSAGTRYGVDPRAIAGAIAAENTLNVQLEDGIQDYIAQFGVTSIAGKTFSIGLGQLNMGPAIEAEAVIAKIEGRAPRSHSEIEQALLNPVESVKLVAGVIRQAQDEYAAKGVDISKRPDILATLYNLGDVRNRAAQVTPENPPRPNYFGAFVGHNITDMQDIIGWSPEKGKYTPTYLNNASFDINYRNTRRPIGLHSKPFNCSSQQQGANVGEISKNSTFRNYREVTQLTGSFTILDHAIDCEMRRWVLVQGQEGQTGWVNHQDLEANSEVSRRPLRTDRRLKRQCEISRQQCLTHIAQLTGTKTEDMGSFLKVTVNAFNNNTTPSIKNFYSECLANQVQTYTGGSSGNSGNNGYGRNMITANGIKVRKMLEELEEKKKSLMQEAGVTSWNDVPDSARSVVDAAIEVIKQNSPSDHGRPGRMYLPVFDGSIYNEVLNVKLPVAAPTPTPQAPAPAPTQPQYFGQGYNSSNYSNYNSNTGSNSTSGITARTVQRGMLYDNTRITLPTGGGASATNITEIEQPLGPASAPRGRQAQKISEQVAMRRELKDSLMTARNSCQKYPNIGLDNPDILTIYSQDDQVRRYLVEEFKNLISDCDFFDKLQSGSDISNTRSCRNGYSANECYIYYLDNNNNFVDGSFSMDYIKANKHLLDPVAILNAKTSQAYKNIDRHLNRNRQGSGSGSGTQDSTDYSRSCSYDPLTTNEKIKQLSELQCVSSVLVPEGDLFNNSERKSLPKVVYRNLEEDGIYQVTFTGCDMEPFKPAEAATEETPESAQ